MTAADGLSWHRQITASVKVNGRALEETWLDAMVALNVQLGYRLPGRCVLRFADPEHKLVANAPAFDSKVTVDIAGKQVFAGVVTGVSLERREHATSDVIVVADDGAHALASRGTVTAFSKMTAADIITKLVADAGLRGRIAATTTQFECVLQTDTHLALVDELTAREGLDWWFEGTTLHVAKPEATTTVELAREQLLAVSVRASGLQRTEVDVTGWSIERKDTVAASLPSAKPAAPAESTMAARAYAASRPGKGKALVSALGPFTDAEAKVLSQAIAGQVGARSIVVRGTMHVDPRIALGTEVKLIDAGPANGTYPVTQVEHSWSTSGFRTRFTAGERRPTMLVDTLGAHAGAPPRRGGLDHGGLVIGVVTNIKDPNKQGRVKLKLPAISTDMETDWARVAMAGAGPDRGVFFLPEVNDEVLVGFEGSDLRRPVVLGGLYNGKDKPKTYDASGTPTTGGRRITSKKGYIVELADGTAPDQQHVLLQLDDVKAKIRLGKDKVEVESPSGKPISLKSGDSSIEIGPDGSITIKGTKVTIEAKTELKLSGANASIAAQAKAELSGQAAVSVKSGGMGEVAATGPLTVKGAMVAIN